MTIIIVFDFRVWKNGRVCRERIGYSTASQATGRIELGMLHTEQVSKSDRQHALCRIRARLLTQ